MFKTISKRQRKVKGPVQIKADLDLEANRWWAVYKTLLGKSSEFEHILCIRKYTGTLNYLGGNNL